MPHGAVINTLHFTEKTQVILDLIAEEFPAELRVGQEPAAVQWIEREVGASCLRGQFNCIPEALERSNAVLVTGLSLAERLPDTPDVYMRPEEAIVYQFDVQHAALALSIGVAHGILHVRDGNIFGDVFPKAAFKDKPDSAFGSAELFDFHSDAAVHPDVQPEVFSLQCIKNPTAVPTVISTVYEDDFDEETFARLQEPVFRLYYQNTEPGAHSIVSPLVRKSADGSLELVYYGARKINFVDDPVSSRAAFAAFSDALTRNAVPTALKPGEVLFVNNKTTLHCRPPFDANATASTERRWLRRMYTARSVALRAIVQESPTRVIKSAFAT